MNTSVPKRIVIAGGGTAGWVAAAALSTQLGKLAKITLVESSDIGTVGVGEATIPTITTFHHLLGIDEQAFMKATRATFKLGISFENWGAVGDSYIHSFGQIGKPTWMGEFHNIWLEAQKEGLGGPLENYCFELQAAKAEKFAISEKLRLNYAYHLDAKAYASFLRELSEKHGVTRIEGKIAEVSQNSETGNIAALLLEDGQQVEGDLFVDCTGFRGLLIEKTLGVGYQDWSEWLPTNSALAIQTEAVRDARPYTRAVAHEAGWRWQIPLQHRVGNGLVYDNHHLSDEEAQDLLMQSIEGKPLTDPLPIRYTTGMRERVWEKNCIALGLSTGFVEPLESTSIHLFMIGITRLIQLFPFGETSEAVRKRYNDMAVNELERVRDFIILHYHATEREDSAFWRQCRNMDIPDTLKERIELFCEYGHAYQAPDDLFRVDSWVQVMFGQRLRPKAHHLMGRVMDKDQIRQVLTGLDANIRNAVERMPTHQAFLEKYCPIN